MTPTRKYVAAVIRHHELATVAAQARDRLAHFEVSDQSSATEYRKLKRDADARGVAAYFAGKEVERCRKAMVDWTVTP